MCCNTYERCRTSSACCICGGSTCFLASVVGKPMLAPLPAELPFVGMPISGSSPLRSGGGGRMSSNGGAHSDHLWTGQDVKSFEVVCGWVVKSMRGTDL